MSDDKVPAMLPDFPRWYRTVDLEENRERLHRRWRGIASLGRASKCDDVETMIRIAFRSRSAPSADSLARVRQFFRDADEFFDAQDNARELEVLCGSTLAFLMQQGSGLAARSALAVTTSALGGARQSDLPMDLPSLAEQAIVALAENGRKRPDLAGYGIDDRVQLSFGSASAMVRQQSDWEGVAAAFGLAAETVRSGLQQIADRSSETSKQASLFIAVQDEELQILWWLFGERSADFDRAFRDLPPKALPLVLAKELADATEFLPGPSDTSLGEGAAEPAAPAPAEVIPPDEPWPTRTVADAAAIKLFRDQFSQSGYHGVGSMCMWLEEQLLAKSREVDALVEAVETCGPHIAAEILAKAGEVVAPKEAFSG